MARSETLLEMFNYLISISNNLVTTCEEVYTKFETQFPQWESLFDPILPTTNMVDFFPLQKIMPSSNIYENVPTINPSMTQNMCAIHVGLFDADEFKPYLGNYVKYIDAAFNDYHTKPKRTASLLALIIYGLRDMPKRYFTATCVKEDYRCDMNLAVFYTMIAQKKQLTGVDVKAAVLLDKMRSVNATELFNTAFDLDYGWDDFDLFGKLNTKSRGDDALRAFADFFNHINNNPQLVELFHDLSKLSNTAFNQRIWLRCLEVAKTQPTEKYLFWSDTEPDTIDRAIELIKEKIQKLTK